MAVTLKSIMEKLLDCFCEQLAAQGWTGACCLETGVVVMDECCSTEGGEPGGKAWVRLVDIFPTERFPSPAQPSDLTAEQVDVAARFEVGAITCMCVELCDCETRTENATRALAIAEALLLSLVCCGDPQSGCIADARFSGLSLVGSADDGCAGYAMTVTVPYGICCPELEE